MQPIWMQRHYARIYTCVQIVRNKERNKTMARPIAETPILYGEDALRFIQRAQYVESLSKKQRQANLRALEERLAQSEHKIEFCL